MNTTLTTAGLCSALLLSSAALAGEHPDGFDPTRAGSVDDRVDPMSRQQREFRGKGLDAVLTGKAVGNQKVKQVAKGQFVELTREGEDPIFTVLGEFADLPHGSIPEPDRSVDNSTIWDPEFGRDYYMNVLFGETNSMRDYYIKQSSNRYAVYGDVTEWVSVPGDGAEYDDGDPVGEVCGDCVWQFLIDSVDGWYQMQLDAGMTPEQIDAYLAQFDLWDRYDWDGDGVFNEPDGYIDHAQFVHSGMGNEAGGGALGDYAIWSHSWFAHYELVGVAGPSPDYRVGGIRIGQSSFWINKYTIQPENGGLGVFAHEYAHDLGVPDLYDYTGENSTGFWTLMSSGSWLGTTEDIGSKPNDLGAWEKFQLGWLNYEVAFAGDKSVHKVGPAETNTKRAQGLFVVLPPKEVVTTISDPYAGSYFYYSGSGNDLANWMFKSYTLDAGSSLTAWVNADIEYGWDYAYLVVSTDGGTSWETVETNFSSTDDPNGQNFGYGITGSSGGAWLQLTADLSAYNGDVLLGFHYWTDVSVVGAGFMVDDIQVGAGPIDGAEGTVDWTFVDFRVSTGSETAHYSNYYLAEFRQYRDYDEGLGLAYNFGWIGDPVYGNWVEHFPYQDGLLISYWDNSFTDNNVGWNCYTGRCGGMLLPIDAHADLLYGADGWPMRNRVQTYDATFGLDATDAITLHQYGEATDLPSLPPVSVFDDTVSHYRPQNPLGSVNHPATGTVVEVKSVSAQNTFMRVEVRPAD